MRSKKKAQVKHARTRGLQRFGYELTPRDLEQMVRLITNSRDKSVFLDRQSLRVSIWAVKWGTEWLPVVYDRQRKSIASILPKEALTPYQELIKKLDEA